MTDHDTWSERQERTTVTVDDHDLEVAYYEANAGADGPPVLLLHGIPTWSFLWRDVAPAVAEDRHVVAPDLVGYGNSDVHDGFDRSIRAQEEALADLVDELDAEEIALVGHDIGGGVALRYAAHRPDAVSRLVLSNAVMYDSWPVEFVTEIGLPDAVSGMDDEEFRETLEGAFDGGLAADDPPDEFVEGMIAPWDDETGRTALERAAVATNTSHTTELDYGAVEAETLCLWGADDEFQPVEYAERFVEDVPAEAAVVELSEAYHWVIEDRTGDYTDHLRSFLADGLDGR